MCPHCGYEHAETTLPPCSACGRMDCVHNPDPPYTVEHSRPTCAGFEVNGEGYEGGGGEFGGGGATGGW